MPKVAALVLALAGADTPTTATTTTNTEATLRLISLDAGGTRLPPGARTILPGQACRVNDIVAGQSTLLTL